MVHCQYTLLLVVISTQGSVESVTGDRLFKTAAPCSPIRHNITGASSVSCEPLLLLVIIRTVQTVLGAYRPSQPSASETVGLERDLRLHQYLLCL